MSGSAGRGEEASSRVQPREKPTLQPTARTGETAEACRRCAVDEGGPTEGNDPEVQTNLRESSGGAAQERGGEKKSGLSVVQTERPALQQENQEPSTGQENSLELIKQATAPSYDLFPESGTMF